MSGVQGSMCWKLDKGTHDHIYRNRLLWKRVAQKDATITVIDASAPVVIAKQNIVLSLTGSGTADGQRSCMVTKWITDRMTTVQRSDSR